MPTSGQPTRNLATLESSRPGLVNRGTTKGIRTRFPDGSGPGGSDVPQHFSVQMPQRRTAVLGWIGDPPCQRDFATNVSTHQFVFPARPSTSWTAFAASLDPYTEPNLFAPPPHEGSSEDLQRAALAEAVKPPLGVPALPGIPSEPRGRRSLASVCLPDHATAVRHPAALKRWCLHSDRYPGIRSTAAHRS